MEYRRFGRTELEVSVVGIGTGGASRLGLAYGNNEDDAIEVVHRGLDIGINYFDTAENYKNEAVLGKALIGHRDEVVLSSKIGTVRPDGSFLDGAGLRNAVELSLGKLGTDVIDVFHFHRLGIRTYEYAINVLVPVMEELREEGKIRFIALSESSGIDIDHEMLKQAVQDDCWDVMMVSFNLFNQSARTQLFPGSIDKDIAVEIMASARAQFSQPDLLVAEIGRLIASGELSPDGINRDNPLDFLSSGDHDITVTEASYRFAANEAGVNVVLVGTGKVEHLEENVEALNRGPLPDEIRERLITMFGHLQAGVYVPNRVLTPN